MHTMFLMALPQGSGYSLQVLAPPKRRGRCGLSSIIPSAKGNASERRIILKRTIFFINIKVNITPQIINFAFLKLKLNYVQ